MQRTALFIIVSIVLSFMACSSVKFGRVATCQHSGYKCELVCEEDGVCHEKFIHEASVGRKMVDVLFVVDNSGSMSTEQRLMSDRIKNFLDKIAHLDYQVAVTTTDVSASRGALLKFGDGVTKDDFYRDGRFLDFTYQGLNVGKVLRHDTPQKELLFRSTVQRPETLFCERNGYRQRYCPSMDERGIYAATLAMKNNKDAGFPRTAGHLAIVILADEDERSRTVMDGQEIKPVIKGFDTFDAADMPANLVSTLDWQFPLKTKTVHSIIVKPGDTACKNRQDDQAEFMRGEYGYTYAALSKSTGGHIGSICAGDYAAQMGVIGGKVAEDVESLPVVCRPLNDEVTIEINPTPREPIQVIKDYEHKRIKFIPSIPESTKIKVSYSCAA